MCSKAEFYKEGRGNDWMQKSRCRDSTTAEQALNASTAYFLVAAHPSFKIENFTQRSNILTLSFISY